jgi:hypothetical protein
MWEFTGIVSPHLIGNAVRLLGQCRRAMLNAMTTNRCTTSNRCDKFRGLALCDLRIQRRYGGPHQLFGRFAMTKGFGYRLRLRLLFSNPHHEGGIL